MPHSARTVFAAVVACSALVLGGCGASTAGNKGPSRPISAWAGEDATLFDDGIDIGTFAQPGSGSANADDEAAIPSRVYKADGTVLAKVIGVNSEPEGDKNRYRLELAVDGDPLSGANPPVPFEIKVEPSSPAFGAIRSQEAQLIGKKLVVYFRRYASDDSDEAITHFHISPNTPKVMGIVKDTAMRKKVEGG
jgi:hypothetical protein